MGLMLSGCAGTKPDGLGVAGGRLAPCPSSPNCVSSEAKKPKHAVEPFTLKGDRAAGWKAVREVVEGMPRTKTVSASKIYLHAECTSLLMRYVDDLELYLGRDSQVIQVRSASRVGYSDMGVNRKRVERLRKVLQERDLIE